VRQHAVNDIGLVDWLNAVPQEWLPQLEQLLRERRQPVIIVPSEPAQTPDDLSIPALLQHELPHHVDEDTALAPADNDDAEILDEDDQDELELTPKRKLKLVECQYTVAEAAAIAFADVTELAEECRGIADDAPDNLQQTGRIMALAESADALEDIEQPDIPEALGAVRLTCALPKRRYTSRAARASDAATLLTACVDALDSEDAAASELISEFEQAIDAIECCEFPGMFG
jgi:hypothetical protein